MIICNQIIITFFLMPLPPHARLLYTTQLVVFHLAYSISALQVSDEIPVYHDLATFFRLIMQVIRFKCVDLI